MMVTVRQQIWCLFVFWTLGFPGFSLEAVAAPEVLQKQIERERIDLQQLREKIRNTKKRRDQTEKEQDSVLKTLEDLDRSSVRKRKEFEVINQQLKDTDKQLGDIGHRLEIFRSGLKAGRHSVLARLRIMYMDGRVGHLRTLLASRSYADFQRRYDYLSAIAKSEFLLLESYRANLEEVEQLKESQAAARETLLNHKKKTEKKLQEIRGIRGEKRALFASLKKERVVHDRTLTVLQRSERRKEALLRAFEQRRKLAEAKAPKSRGRLPRAGSLIWPADGEVVSLFGRQKHPTFDTYVKKKGIEIRTTEGSSIRAAASGAVVYADWLKGYGLVVILEHPNGFFSLYAHASKLLVKERDPVGAGQLIGETGESGMTEEGMLYFELRRGTEPVDPLLWLVKRP